jgi:hypothetical protein
MAGFRIEWKFGKLPISDTARDVFFGSAADRWANVITGWPKGAGGRPALDVLTIEVRMTDLNKKRDPNGSFILAHVDVRDQLKSGPAKHIPTRARISLDKVKFVDRFQQDGPATADLIAHEIGHALGFGETWAKRGLLREVGTKVFYTGKHAVAEYRSWTAANKAKPGVPVEDTGGQNTALEHWKENSSDTSRQGLRLTFELMSGNLEHGDNRLTRLTVAAMKDLGYQVDMDAADDYRTHA